MRVSAPTRHYTAVAKALRQWLAAHHAQDRKPVRAFVRRVEREFERQRAAEAARIRGDGPRNRVTKTKGPVGFFNGRNEAA